MGQGPDELRRDIERRRDDLGETLDAIGDRVSPGRMVERRRNRMTNGMRSVKERVMGTMGSGTERIEDVAGSVRDHIGADAVKQQTAGAPLGAGLVAFGIGFLVAAAMPASQPETEMAERFSDQLEPAKEKMKEVGMSVADDLKDDVQQAAEQVKESASSAASNVAADAKQHAEATKDEARSMRESGR